MKRYFILLLCFLSVMACKEEGLPPGPSISYTSNPDITGGICVGQVVEIVIQLRTDASVGIQQFVVVKNDMDTLVNETFFLTNNLNFTLNYGPTSDDLARGDVDMEFFLTDKAQITVSQAINFDVESEFGFRVDQMVPGPSWDLANNIALAATDGSDVDIQLTIEEEDCGIGCTRYRMTFTSKNDTRFYDIPFDPVVNAFSNTTKQQDVLDVITGITAVDELVVFSDFPEDIGANGGINAFPLVAKIRGTDEYAIFDKLSTPGEFLYKKRTELAGN